VTPFQAPVTCNCKKRPDMLAFLVPGRGKAHKVPHKKKTYGPVNLIPREQKKVGGSAVFAGNTKN